MEETCGSRDDVLLVRWLVQRSVSCFRSQGAVKIRDAFYNTLVANQTWGQVN